MTYATGGPLPPRDDGDAIPAFIDPGCTYYIPRSQLNQLGHEAGPLLLAQLGLNPESTSNPHQPSIS